jgi:glycosyltransferase involved in cell wall biosynthesis
MESKISFVIPLLNEQDSLWELYAAIRAVVTENGYPYEILFVDDGSTDGSVRILRELAEQDENVSVIIFRKNFGKATALQTGFRHVAGDIVFTMDADLQDDPKEVPRFIAKLDEGYDMVSGWKKNRLDPAEKRLPSKLFNKFTSAMSGVKLHDFNCGFKAYRREVVDSIDLYGELHRYIPVLASKKGFKVAEIAVEHHERRFGKSKYGVSRYLRGLFDSMTTTFLSRYSDKPMYFFGKMGLWFLAVGLILGVFLSVQWFMGNSIGGRPLLTLCMMLVILGATLFAIGFLGDMIVAALYRMRYDESHVKTIVCRERERDD